MAAVNRSLDVQSCIAAPPSDNNIDHTPSDNNIDHTPSDNNIDHTPSISQDTQCSIVPQLSTPDNAVATYRLQATHIPSSLSAYLPNTCTNANLTNNRCIRPSLGTLRQFGSEISNVAPRTLDDLSNYTGYPFPKYVELNKAPEFDETIKNFRIISLIGTGHFGKVILTQYRPSDEYCALKVLKKVDQVKKDEAKSVMIEKRIFELVSKRKHPFLVNFFTCMQSREHLIFVMEYLPGGDLLHHRSSDYFTEDLCCFYAACVVLALEFLHSKNIMHRDLKLDNLVLERSGYVKLTDFGLCKEGMGPTDYTHTFCGTPHVTAPEMLSGDGYTRAIDWWCLGILLFEMLVGKEPFIGDGDDLFLSIVRQNVPFPSFLSNESFTILRKLLIKNPLVRLGFGLNGAEDVKRQQFFKHIDWEWEKLLRKELKPKFVPQIKNMEDVCNFDEEFTKEVPRFSSAKDKRVITDTDQALFKDFDFTSFVE